MDKIFKVELTWSLYRNVHPALFGIRRILFKELKVSSGTEISNSSACNLVFLVLVSLQSADYLFIMFMTTCVSSSHILVSSNFTDCYVTASASFCSPACYGFVFKYNAV